MTFAYAGPRHSVSAASNIGVKLATELADPPGRGDGPRDLALAEPGPGSRCGELVEVARAAGFDDPGSGPEQPGVAVALGQLLGGLA